MLVPSTNLSFSSSELINFMERFLFTQYINENTRKNNILDLFITDDPNFVQLVKVEDTILSDHNLIKIFNTFFSGLSTDTVTPTKLNLPIDFSNLNLNTADFTGINSAFSQIDWEEVVDGQVEQFPDRFHRLVYSVLAEHYKLKIQGFNKKKHPFKEGLI